MKNLIIALLIFGAFTACKKPAKPVSANQTNTPALEVAKDSAVASTNNVAPTTALKIGFVLSDTVLNRYTYYQKIKNNLTSKGQKLDKEIEGRASEIQKEYAGYQAKGQSMSPKELQAAEMSLMKKQQDLEAYKNQKGAELMKEENSLNLDLQKRIEGFLEKYASENGYTFILSKHAGGSVLYGIKALDVTNEVVKGLNNQAKK